MLAIICGDYQPEERIQMYRKRTSFHPNMLAGAPLVVDCTNLYKLSKPPIWSLNRQVKAHKMTENLPIKASILTMI